jgi:hypothetical protein
MYIFSLGLLGALAAQVVAVPVPAGHVVHERRDYVPDTWAKHDRVDPTVLRVATFDPRYDITWRMSVHQSMRSVPEPSVLCHNLLLARARVRYAPELDVFCNRLLSQLP